ncbi:hypothetical protein [Pseudolactococcus carnosus]|jgi:hypothetical protein|uniref:hypothetical protein n=1 Tax=Pseudolactococcus carnosus TaxID=2749961 RepID=UPI001FBACC6A|nr:hypothetical protein [Lactococcus carnosus]
MWSDTEKKIFEIGSAQISKKISRFVANSVEYRYEFEANADYDKLYTSATFITQGESLKIRKLNITEKVIER